MKDFSNHFIYIFWFAVGLCLYAAGLSIYVIRLDPHQIPMVLTFWLTSAAGAAIGFLIGSSLNKNKPQDPGTTTAEMTATITQAPTEPTNTTNT